MSFWIAVVLLSAITLFLLAAPLWRKSKEEAVRADYDLNVFKDQLKELERDLERNLINEDEAETARLEIQRRLLAADEKRQKQETQRFSVSKGSIVFSALTGLIVIGGTMVLYGKLGMPGYGDMPYASRDIQKESQRAAGNSEGMAREIAMLQQRLEQDGSDVDAWMLLGRTLRAVGRSDESLEAYKNAVKHSDRHPAVLADYAEAQIYADQGAVKKETMDSLKEALQADPMQLKAWFYLGYAKARAEDYSAAVQIWTDLVAMAPGEAPWLAQVRKQIDMAAEAGGLNLADFKPSEMAQKLSKRFALEWEKEAEAQAQAAPGPTREQMQQAQDMSDEERADMIRSMVQRLADRLEENPDDIAGWQRLANAYQVLGEKDKAIEAMNKVKELSAK